MDNEAKEIKINPEEWNKASFEPAYSNHIQLMNTQEEFVFDFMALLPPMGTLLKRIVLSPGHAKRLAGVLNQNIESYEKQFGKIPETQSPFVK